MATVPTSEDLVALYEQGMLVGEMAHRFRLSDQAEIRIVEGRCSELHNAGAIDLLQVVEKDALQGFNGTDFFMAAHVFCRILPELEATPTRMMACVEALVARGGEDLAATQPNAAFRAWCNKDPRRSRDVIAMARVGDELAIRHLTFALEAINAINEARQIALEYDDARRLYSITALGRMEDVDPASRAETLAVFGSLLASGADDNLRASMLHATAANLARSREVPSPETLALVWS